MKFQEMLHFNGKLKLILIKLIKVKRPPNPYKNLAHSKGWRLGAQKVEFLQQILNLASFSGISWNFVKFHEMAQNSAKGEPWAHPGRVTTLKPDA